jgi:uridine kinase
MIGIAGGSCSGKTLIAEGISGALRPGSRVLVLGLDSYYNDFTGVRHDQIEVDVPEALDKECLVQQLGALAVGRSVERPMYDYVTHSRRPRGERVDPGDYVIVEGLFALYWQEVRDLLELKVFVLIDHDTALSRRLERDIRERGRTEQSVRSQYLHTVIPMYERYVHPTRDYAELTLNGLDPVESSVERIRAAVPPKP